MAKPKLLVFHPALAPYRIDQFNFLSTIFELKVIFLFSNVDGHGFNQEKLTSQLTCEYSFLTDGIDFGGRVFRFGMLQAIKDFKPDVILGHEYSLSTQYLILLKKLGIIEQKIGSTIDDSIHICHAVQSYIRGIARSIGAKNLDFLVVLSEEIAEFYHSRFSVDKDRIVVFPILQKPDRLRSNKELIEKKAEQYVDKFDLKNKRVLLFVGRIAPEKGLLEFIRNISRSLKSKHDLKFIIIGNGPLERKLKDFVNDQGLEKQIILPGRFEGEDLYAWYLCGDGFILPSTYEPFGAVINEALIFGLSVLCSKYAGASYLINNKRGIIFDPLQENETKEKFEEFIKSTRSLDKPEIDAKKPAISFNEKEFQKQWSNLCK